MKKEKLTWEEKKENWRTFIPNIKKEFKDNPITIKDVGLFLMWALIMMLPMGMIYHTQNRLQYCTYETMLEQRIPLDIGYVNNNMFVNNEIEVKTHYPESLAYYVKYLKVNPPRSGYILNCTWNLTRGWDNTKRMLGVEVRE